MQRTLGVGGCVNICFGHVPIAVRQGQRRDAVVTGEEQLGRCAARKSKYIRLYLYSGKLILAATYYRRVFVDGRSLAAGALALAHVCTVGACGIKPRRGPPAALPEESVWCMPGAMARISPERPATPRSTTTYSLNSEPRSLRWVKLAKHQPRSHQITPIFF